MPGTRAKNCFSIPAVTGSLSANVHKNGLSNCSKNSQAKRCCSRDGDVGSVGTWLGIARGPILKLGSGKGASYAFAISVGKGDAIPALWSKNFTALTTFDGCSIVMDIMKPIGRSSDSQQNFCQ